MKRFDQIPEELKDLFHQKSEKVEFSIGQVFCDFDATPKGLLHLIKGELRLIYKDKNKGISTIKIYKTGDIVGLEQILCGTRGTCLRASSKLEANYLETDYFLNFLANNANFQFFDDFTKYEFLNVLIALENKLKIKNIDLIENLKNFNEKQEIKIKLFKPGKHILKSHLKEFLITSNNIKNYKEGDVVSSGDKLEVIGNLPARIIDTAKLSIFSNNKKISFGSNLKVTTFYENQKNLNDKKEALADMFGVINYQDSFPHFNGVGVSRSTIACLRMLSRFFDLPFRRDILKRIIDDQNNFSDKEQLNISKLAALINFLGLRTTPLNPDSKSLIQRIPLPSIFIFKNRPLMTFLP